MSQAARDNNNVPTILGVSSSDVTTPEKIAVDPATNRMLVSAVVTAGATTATEYTEGDVDASIAGIAVLGEGPSNTLKALQTDASGNLLTNVFSYTRVTADTQIKASAGFIHTISIAPTGTPVAGVLTVYDQTTEASPPVFSVSLPASVFTPFTVTLDVSTSTGIYIGYDGTLTNTQATISWR